MHQISRRAATAVGAAVMLAAGFTATAGPASAADTCPAGKYCLYDNADFTKPLVISDTRQVRWIGAELNDRVSSVVNNTGTVLHLCKDVNWSKRITYVHPGQRHVFTGADDNAVSSYYLY